MGLCKQVKILGYIPESEMPLLYLSAQMMVFPSLFEGFGIPIIEAMKMGCPVLCSNNTSIPELAGDAVVYFNENDYIDIAKKIKNLMDVDSRSKMIKKGIVNSKRCSWKESARQTIEVFEKVVNGNIVNKNNRNPFVSIITPSYNQGKYIHKTINSVLRQKYPNMEYLVIDGGSTDNTLDILKKYSKFVKWISEKDHGQSDAVNKGIQLVKGEIIGWLNSDDIYYPDAINKVVALFEKYNHVEMVYGESNNINDKDEVIDRYPTKSFNYNDLAENCFISQPTVFF